MNMKLLSIITVLLLAVFLSACAPAGNAPGLSLPSTAPTHTHASAPATEGNATAAPDFTVYDLDGNPVKLSDFRGKPVVLNFWASWCPPCKSEMPDFNEVYAAYGQDIHFLMVNLTDGTRETVTSASDFIKNAGYHFPVYYDTSSEASTAYGIYSIPTTFFIDAQGNVVAYGSGALDKQSLENGISMIFTP